LVKKKKQPKDI
jgi:hypothetical protein